MMRSLREAPGCSVIIYDQTCARGDSPDCDMVTAR